jgi:dTDP-glucose 4,6-dehydratase
MLGLSDRLLTFVPDRLGHVRRHAVNASKLRERLGWAPTMPYEQGLAETIAWYQSHTEWLRRLAARRDTFLERARVHGAPSL